MIVATEFQISDIPNLLRKKRQQDGLTLKQASERIGISLSYLSDIECGRTTPTLETLFKIVNGYGLVLALRIAAQEDQL